MLASSAPQRTAPGGGGGKSGGVALTPGCQPIAYSARLAHVLTGPHTPLSPLGGGSVPSAGRGSPALGGGSASVGIGSPPSVGGTGSVGASLVGARHTGSASCRHVASTDLLQVARQRRRSRREPSLHSLRQLPISAAQSARHRFACAGATRQKPASTRIVAIRIMVPPFGAVVRRNWSRNATPVPTFRNRACAARTALQPCRR